MSATVLMTGCSSGIGLATSVAAARAGYRVIATMRDPGRADQLRAACADAGVEIDVRRLDVTAEAEVSACVDGVIADYGRLDAVINNAGHGNTFATIETCSMQRFRANIEANFFGVVAVTKAALPHLRASHGRVITIGSTRGLIGQPFNEGYCAAKFAVEGFFESLSPVARAMGVTCVVVVPGPVLGTSFGANTGLTVESILADAGPYAEVLRPYLAWVRNGNYPGAQTAEELAETLVRVLAQPDPPLRVFSSDWGDDWVRTKVVDADGSMIQGLASSWITSTEG